MSDLRGASSSIPGTSCSQQNPRAPFDKLASLITTPSIDRLQSQVPADKNEVSPNTKLLNGQGSQLNEEFDGSFCYSRGVLSSSSQFSTPLTLPLPPIQSSSKAWAAEFKGTIQNFKSLGDNSTAPSTHQESSPPISFESNCSQIVDAEDEFWDNVEHIYGRSSTFWNWEQSQQTKSFADILESTRDSDDKEVAARRIALILRHLS
jgi:hypothetical protein